MTTGTTTPEPPPPEDQGLGWVWYRSVGEDGEPNATHCVPLEDFVHTLDGEGRCICGPDRTEIEHYSSAFRHWPLDGRYYELDLE